MTNSPIPGSPRPNSLHGTEGASPASSSKARGAKPSGDSAAFRVLLDKLQAQALELEQKSQAVEAPEHLAEAVDMARTSLDDALSLSDQLLERFREAELTGPAASDTDATAGEDAS